MIATEYYRDETDELWIVTNSSNYDVKTPAFYRQTFWAISFDHADPLNHVLRPIEKRDLNYLELDNVERFLHELGDWLEREKMRKSSLVFGKTEKIVDYIHRVACGLWE